MKIIVVDDEPDVQFLFKQRFRREIRKEEIEFNFFLSA
ncbi:TPA: response regulator, partial [Candidatus Poribacteria bacterium]|nr:response regulator [Candidatus Poribacteria bacterium]